MFNIYDKIIHEWNYFLETGKLDQLNDNGSELFYYISEFDIEGYRKCVLRKRNNSAHKFKIVFELKSILEFTDDTSSALYAAIKDTLNGFSQSFTLPWLVGQVYHLDQRKGRCFFEKLYVDLVDKPDLSLLKYVSIDGKSIKLPPIEGKEYHVEDRFK